MLINYLQKNIKFVFRVLLHIPIPTYYYNNFFFFIKNFKDSLVANRNIP